ncbi:MAG: lamin tail domain-containing protein [Bacteroidota bacterium]|nr:lamin tail domain-containing protein [Bacteroidota bacterium]
MASPLTMRKAHFVHIGRIWSACMLLGLSANAQINTTFDDSSAWKSAWWGDTSAFTCHNGLLQLNADPSLGLARIASNSSAHNQGQFYGKVSLEFNPSSMNHMVLDLVKGPEFTYSLVIGKEEDKVQWRYTTSDEEVILLQSQEDYLDHTQVHLEFWLNFDSLGYWHLSTRLLDNLAMDSGFVQYWGSHHFVRGGLATEVGIQCVYTSSRADKFFVDALYVEGQPFQDVFPPRILSFSLRGVRQIQVRASEEVLPLQDLSSYNSGDYQCLSSETQSNTLFLQFNKVFAHGDTLYWDSFTLQDSLGNQVTFIPEPIVIDHVDFQDVVVSQVMEDALPAYNLPGVEFIELTNLGDENVSLGQWKVTVNEDTIYLPNIELLAQQKVLFSKSSSAIILQTYLDSVSSDQNLCAPRIWAVDSWFDLPSTGIIQLIDHRRVPQDIAQYSQDSYGQAYHISGNLMSLGGVALSRVLGQNRFSGSTSPDGALLTCFLEEEFSALTNQGLTHGRVDAIHSNMLLLEMSAVVAYTEIVRCLRLYDHEQNPVAYSLQKTPYDTTSWHLSLSQSLNPASTYHIQWHSPLPFESDSSAITWTFDRIQLPQMVSNMAEVSITEVMDDPFSGECEYIELYNPGDNSMDLKELLIWTKREGQVIDVERIEREALQIRAGEHLVTSQADCDLTSLAPASNQYLSVSLPALDNKTKGVFIGFALDSLLDSIHIDETIQDIPWQKGYALERISNGLDYLPSWWIAPSQSRGSPTRQNNQILQDGAKGENCLSLSSQVVSLNGDGISDILEVQLTDNAWSQGGYRIDVFSMAGHHCKQIAYAEVGGAQDHWYWDGSTDDGVVLPPDFYILTMQGLSALSPPRCSVPILVMY